MALPFSLPLGGNTKSCKHKNVSRQLFIYTSRTLRKIFVFFACKSQQYIHLPLFIYVKPLTLIPKPDP